MYKFKKILLAFDIYNHEGNALEHAIERAIANEAILEVLYVCPKYHVPAFDTYLSEDAGAKIKHDALEKLEALCKEKIPESVQWEALVDEQKGKKSYQVIIDNADAKQVDLIIMGAHDRHKLDHIWLGTNTEKVVRYAHCSVMVIKEKH